MSALLNARNLTFAYTDHPVVRDVAISLHAGEVVALLGPNGSGKSTLIKLLLGHLRADSGSISWEDRDLKSWNRRQLAQRIAYLPQNPTANPEQAVGDVLRLGRAPYWRAFGIESPQDMKVVGETAAMLQLSELIDRPMDELSGGQRQRVFIGRCLVQEPRAMLLDEPGTFLDLRHQVELCQLLLKLTRDCGIGVLMASHDLNLAGLFADRLVLLHDGAVAGVGDPRQVLDPALLSRVYGLSMRRIETGDGGAPLVLPSWSRALRSRT
jgi:iron complex transport system ATP-binding protein